ncbi:MAG: transporter [Chloroflexi bacterium]|nr:transporter [Chloroflexota bacterium]
MQARNKKDASDPMKPQISRTESQAAELAPERGRLNSLKVILVLSTIMALQMTSFVMIVPLFARRFNEFGTGVAALGLSAMAYALVSTVTAPFMGALADRFGRRPLVLGSLAGYVAAFCGYLLAPTAGVLIVLRGITGAFTAALIPAVTGLASDLAPDDRRAQWIGFVNGGASFGWIAGPIAGGMIYDRWGYSAALIVSIVIAGVTFLVALLAVPESRLVNERTSPAAARHPSRGWRKSLQGSLANLRSSLPNSMPTFFALLFICFAVLFAWAFMEPEFMFYAYNDLDWSSSMLGLVMSTFGVAMMLGEFGFGRLSDRVGRKPIILIGLVLFSAQFLGLAFFSNYLLIAATFTIAGLGNALFDPALTASILDISPAEHRARMLGIKYTAGSIGNILGPALVVLVTSSVSENGIFLMAFGVVLLAILVGLTIKIDVQPSESEAEQAVVSMESSISHKSLFSGDT